MPMLNPQKEGHFHQHFDLKSKCHVLNSGKIKFYKSIVNQLFAHFLDKK